MANQELLLCLEVEHVLQTSQPLLCLLLAKSLRYAGYYSSWFYF